MTRNEARTETSRQLSNARETLKLAKSQGAKTRAQNKIDYLVAVQKALCEPSREQVEKVWRGKWIIPTIIGGRAYNIPHCSACNGVPCGTDEHTRFCAHCGAPMTDEAMEILWKRWKDEY